MKEAEELMQKLTEAFSHLGLSLKKFADMFIPLAMELYEALPPEVKIEIEEMFDCGEEGEVEDFTASQDTTIEKIRQNAEYN